MNAVFVLSTLNVNVEKVMTHTSCIILIHCSNKSVTFNEFYIVTNLTLYVLHSSFALHPFGGELDFLPSKSMETPSKTLRTYTHNRKEAIPTHTNAHRYTQDW